MEATHVADVGKCVHGAGGLETTWQGYTEAPEAPTSGRPAPTEARSSTGRAPVSKTGGWGFESLRACKGAA